MIEKILWAISIFGAKTKKGLVELRLDDKNLQISPSEARDFAHNILEAAEAAESDEFIIKFFEKLMGYELKDEKKVEILREFRNLKELNRRLKEK